MPTLAAILLLTILGSVVSLSGGFILLLKKNLSYPLTLMLTGFAAGVLLATAFLDLFPEAAQHLESGEGSVFTLGLIGIVVFFLLERSFLWFHHHHEAHGVKPTVWMITIGDGLHNFIDGVAIAATYMINPILGISTSLAVAAHEIPQEIADFSVLISHGLSKKRAILFNVLSALTAIVGAVGTYFFLPYIEPYLGFIIAFTAGMFSYISLSDLIPELHHTGFRKDTVTQVITFGMGILSVYLLKLIIPHTQ